MARPVHFEIHGSQPEVLVDLYCALFGWTVQRWGEEQYWLVSTGTGDGINGAIMLRRGPAPALGAPVMGAVLTMGVEDVDATLKRGIELGAELSVAKMPVPGMGWVAYLHDPDGNVFGLFQADVGAK